MANTLDYGLELTNNSKVGWAFSLPRTETCVGSTALCRRLCYGRGIRYQSAGQKAKRNRNFRTAEFLLANGGPDLLAKNLAMLVERARPRDWLTARITGTETAIPWSLRLHDLGDFYSTSYTEAWYQVVEKYDQCLFWFYTRSFLEVDLFESLTKLAGLPNCQGWLSIDSDNFEQGILAKCSAPAAAWKLALLQDKDLNADVVPAIAQVAVAGDVVSFPYHHGGRHVEPVRDKILNVCPAITGALTLKSRADVVRPCQACAFCLP